MIHIIFDIKWLLMNDVRLSLWMCYDLNNFMVLLHFEFGVGVEWFGNRKDAQNHLKNRVFATAQDTRPVRPALLLTILKTSLFLIFEVPTLFLFHPQLKGK